MADFNSGKKVRTRNTSGTKLAENLGGAGKEFLATEVPTLRDVLRKGILIQEEKMLEEGGGRKNYPVRDMIDDLVTAVYLQWEISNKKFKHPVVSERKPMVNRLKNAWEKINLIALKKETKKMVISIWESKLDRLFDITFCQCPITLCSDTPNPPCKEDCKLEAHIKCACTLPQKIPVLELSWLKSQREKIGTKSKQQMISADKKETEKQNKAERRKQKDQNLLDIQKEKNKIVIESQFTKVDITGK